MSLNDLFRSLFGFHKYDAHPRERGFVDDDDDDDWSNESPDRGGMDDIFSHFHDEMQTQMGELHRQMEDMIKNFGAVEFPPAFQNPSLDQEAPSPRDHMLKEGESGPGRDTRVVPEIPRHGPDRFQTPSIFGGLFSIPKWDRVRPQDKVDQDLDGKVEAKDIAKLFEKRRPSQEEPMLRRDEPSFFSRHNSVSVRTIVGADGKVEQRKTVRDSSGNEETTITRSLGDKSHTMTSKQDSRGIQGKQESFQNMDEKDLSSFEEQWNRSGDRAKAADPRERMLLPPSGDNDDNASLFKKLFGFDLRKPPS